MDGSAMVRPPASGSLVFRHAPPPCIAARLGCAMHGVGDVFALLSVRLTTSPEVCNFEQTR